MPGHHWLETFPGRKDHKRDTPTPELPLRRQPMQDERARMGQALYLQDTTYLPRAMGAEKDYSPRPNKGLSEAPRAVTGIGGNGPIQHLTGKPVSPGGGLQLFTLLFL